MRLGSASGRTAHPECWRPFTEDRPNPGHGHGIDSRCYFADGGQQFTFGYSYNTWDYYPHDVSQMDRNLMNNPPHWFDEKSGGFATDGNLPRPTLSPGAQNFAFWVPAISSASVANPGTNHPYTNWNRSYTISDNFSKVQGSHSFKAGIYVERTSKVEQASVGSYLGNYTFSGGPKDANYGNANLFLGNFGSYSEGGRSIGDYRFTGVEAFIQDNWRVTRRLTLDLGVRFYDIQPQENINNNNAIWLPSAYDPSKAAGCMSTAVRFQHRLSGNAPPRARWRWIREPAQPLTPASWARSCPARAITSTAPW
jgi:outer membrane receptor protein involved in Fe transport